MRNDQDGIILLEAIIGFAILGLFAGLVLQHLQFTAERSGYELSRARIVAESANLMERIGFDIPLKDGTVTGTFALVQNATWQLDIKSYSEGSEPTSNDLFSNLKHIQLVARWPQGTAQRQVGFNTLRRITR